MTVYSLGTFIFSLLASVATQVDRLLRQLCNASFAFFPLADCRTSKVQECVRWRTDALTAGAGCWRGHFSRSHNLARSNCGNYAL